MIESIVFVILIIFCLKKIFFKNEEMDIYIEIFIILLGLFTFSIRHKDVSIIILAVCIFLISIGINLYTKINIFVINIKLALCIFIPLLVLRIFPWNIDFALSSKYGMNVIYEVSSIILITIMLIGKIPECIIYKLNEIINKHYFIINSMYSIILICFFSNMYDKSSFVLTEVIYNGWNIFFIINILNIYLYFQEKEDNGKGIVQYDSFLQEFLEKLKAEEHEYKNHLNTLYAMVQVSSQEEIRMNIDNYMLRLKSKEYLSKLLYVDNIILKSVLYSKMCEAEKFNIDVELNISSNLKNIEVKEEDLVVLINNLITNSLEEARKHIGGKVIVEIYEKENSVIKVSNTIENNNVDIHNIFKRKYSTKGKNRGYGLYNVKKL